MAKVINLNRVRKARARDDQRAQADENAVRHGRSKAEKTLDQAKIDKLRDHLDQHRLDE